jgi:hypothetical protein
VPEIASTVYGGPSPDNAGYQPTVAASPYETPGYEPNVPCGVSSCSVEKVNDDGSTGTGTISYKFGNGRSGPVAYRLTNENGTWKITHEGNQ